MNIYKIVITGPVGAGKTSMIAALCDGDFVSTEEVATDDTSKFKPTTTVAMDYGVFKFADHCQLHLYGTPGQQRFNFMWTILSKNCLGLVVLLDASSFNLLGDLDVYLDAFSDKLNSASLAIGITRSGELNQINRESMERMVRRRVAQKSNEQLSQLLPIQFLNAQKKHEVANLLLALVSNIKTQSV